LRDFGALFPGERLRVARAADSAHTLTGDRIELDNGDMLRRAGGQEVPARSKASAKPTVVRLAYWSAAVALVIVYYAVPSARPFVVALVGALGVAGIVIGVASLRRQRGRAWPVVVVAVALVVAGDIVSVVSAYSAPGPLAYPGPQVGLFLLAYLPLAVGLFLLGRPRLPSRDSLMVLDVLALSLALSLIAWYFFARPVIQSLQLSGVGLWAAIASWVGYSVVLALAARALVSWRANPPVALLNGGVVALLTANLLFLRELVTNGWQSGGLIDVGVLAIGAVCGGAALTTSKTTMASTNHAEHRLGPLRLTMLALALLLAPAVLLHQATSHGVTTGVAIAIASGAVGIVTLIRIWLSARLYQQRLDRVDAVRTASRALLSATTERDVIESARVALSTMLPADTGHGVRLVGGPPEAARELRARLWRRGDGDVGDLAVWMPTDPSPVKDGRRQSRRDEPGPLWGEEPAPNWVHDSDAALRHGPRNMLVYTAPATALLELWSALIALSDLAWSALERIGLVAALASEERERYFRTLVMTSTDVTLISRGGRIDYATPSSHAMFGRDVLGEAFEDLVYRRPERRDSDEPWSDTVDGEDGYVFRSGGESEIVVVHRRDLANDETIRGVVSTLRNVTSERTLQRDLAHRATHDPLTGLANVELFGRELRSAVHHGQDRRRSAGRAALFVDLDDFKAINDTYGHEIGDRVLVETARRIEACLRPEDLAARIGGDEFAVLLRDVPDGATAGGIAQRIVDALAGDQTAETTIATSQASVGVAYVSGPIDPDVLLRQADAALYEAKAHGKGEWRLYAEGTAALDG
jgi:diguanylate cyclase (GGDEF)-like protein